MNPADDRAVRKPKAATKGAIKALEGRVTDIEIQTGDPDDSDGGETKWASEIMTDLLKDCPSVPQDQGKGNKAKQNDRARRISHMLKNDPRYAKLKDVIPIIHRRADSGLMLDLAAAWSQIHRSRIEVVALARAPDTGARDRTTQQAKNSKTSHRHRSPASSNDDTGDEADSIVRKFSSSQNTTASDQGIRQGSHAKRHAAEPVKTSNSQLESNDKVRPKKRAHDSAEDINTGKRSKIDDGVAWQLHMWVIAKEWDNEADLIFTRSYTTEQIYFDAIRLVANESIVISGLTSEAAAIYFTDVDNRILPFIESSFHMDKTARVSQHVAERILHIFSIPASNKVTTLDARLLCKKAGATVLKADMSELTRSLRAASAEE